MFFWAGSLTTKKELNDYINTTQLRTRIREIPMSRPRYTYTKNAWSIDNQHDVHTIQQTCFRAASFPSSM